MFGSRQIFKFVNLPNNVSMASLLSMYYRVPML